MTKLENILFGVMMVCLGIALGLSVVLMFDYRL